VYIKNILQPGATIKLRQKVVFFRILATMVNASLTVLKSLSSLKKQEKDPNMVKFYAFMIDKIQ
jgi:type II secretory pathway component PulF